jgi:hypothetical protein
MFHHALGTVAAKMMVIRALIKRTIVPSNIRYASLYQGQNVTVRLEYFTHHRGRLRTPFEYCSALIPLKRSIVGYKAKKAG